MMSPYQGKIRERTEGFGKAANITLAIAVFTGICVFGYFYLPGPSLLLKAVGFTLAVYNIFATTVVAPIADAMGK